MVVHKIISTLFLIMLVSLKLGCIATVAQETSTSQSHLICNGNNTANIPTFRVYFRMGLVSLQSSLNHKLFDNYYSRSLNFNPIVYMSYLCRGDVNSTRCNDCVSGATQIALHNCSKGTTDAVVWSEACMFRYSDSNFYGHMDDSQVFIDPGYQPLNPASVNVTRFSDALKEVTDAILLTLRKRLIGGKYNGINSMFNPKVANVSKEKKIYAVGQCSWDLYLGDCIKCVQECVQRLPAGKVGGRVMFPSCNLRYEMHRFYDNNGGQGMQGSTVSPHAPPLRNPRDAPPPQPSNSPTHPVVDGGMLPGDKKVDPLKWARKSDGEHIAGYVVTAVVLMLVVSGALFCTHRRKKYEQAFIEMEEITNADSFQLELSKIRAATHNFAADKKLGQGGFGEVYKGKLESGQMIAVKRLSRDSRQGIAEFKTEILLVANLQHRNLVKLLGFCFSGKEKILVYEYLSNSSLDRILFDPIKREALDWETRYKIISGIGKGLLYLHEDSRLKIIHRDLKTSNILLDDFMNPKISDFGMAKLFGVDQTQDATKTIVGTYGYMAPEYMLTGQYSVKSDIYSFGIIVLEMVTGLRNSYMSRPLLEEALLHRAWRLWNEGSVFELVDYVLGDAYSREEVIKCIHIAMLCIQEDALRRPNVTWVVAAIRDETSHFPAPTPPNFFSSIRRSASGSCSGTDPSVNSSTARDTLMDLHGR